MNPVMKSICILSLIIVGVLLCFGSVSACPLDGGVPATVPLYIEIYSASEHGWLFSAWNPVPNATVVATPVIPDFWYQLPTEFGIQPSAIADIPVVNGTTDGNGMVNLYMYRSIGYNLSITTTDGKTKNLKLYPTYDTYQISIYSWE